MKLIAVNENVHTRGNCLYFVMISRIIRHPTRQESVVRVVECLVKTRSD